MSQNTFGKIPDYLLQHLQYLRNLNLECPKIGNIYLQDTALIQYTRDIIGNNQLFAKELERLGDRFSTSYLQASRNAQQNHPRLQQFDTYGRRIDKLHLSEGWKRIAKMSAEDGVVSLAYENDQFNLKQMQRFGQLIALYLYQPSSGLFGCPLAMTDGAAYTIRSILQREKAGFKKNLLEKAYSHLISRTQPWTSGQWMTQKKGGSDVSNTETIAIKEPNQNFYRLYGYKWFTSATDSDMSLGLAKVVPYGVQPTPEVLKSIKVSLFFIKMRNEQKQLNNMQIIRLKDKLGTRQLPTAELLLKGSQAYLISEEQQGVKYISKMLTVTRLYNASTAVGIMRRMVALSRDYSSRRTIGKVKLSQLPLQLRVLSQMEVTHRANLIFFIKISQLFSKQHSKVINDDEANLLRIMTPLLKLFTGKQVLQVCTEGLESFGGMGYIEGSMLPVLLRDAQVLSIWQGTTNVLCYDFVRALLKKQNSINPIDSFIRFATEIFQKIHLRQVKDGQFTKSNQALVLSYNSIVRDLTFVLKNNFKTFQQVSQGKNNKINPFAELRTICFGVSRIFIALLLQNHVLLTFRSKDIEVASRWIERGLYNKQNYDCNYDRKLAMDTDGQGKQRGCGDFDSRRIQRGKL